MKVRVGDVIRIIEMKDEPHYGGRVGVVQFVDSMNQIHGTWGGCALIDGVDRFEVIKSDNKNTKNYVV